MRIIIFILLLSFNLSSQVEIKPISEIENASPYKIILLTADWCQICRKEKEVIKKSKSIDSLTKGNCSFFEFNTESKDVVFFDKKEYGFSPNGLNTGSHEFTSFLSNGNAPTLPSVYIYNENNQLIQHFDGFLSEGDWFQLLSNLLFD